MRRRAFTLVELMTVVAILAILYAVFMPVFVQVKRYAQQYVAGEAMMRYGTASAMYMLDSDECYPIAYYQLPNGQRQNWFGIVAKDGSVDPSTSLLSPYVQGRIQPDAALNARPWMGDGTGFGYNWGYLGSDFYLPNSASTWLTCANPAYSSEVGDPSSTIEFGTSSYYFAPWVPHGDGMTYRYGFVDPPKAWYGNPTLDFRHMGDKHVDKKVHLVTSTGVALVLYADTHMTPLHQRAVKNEMFDRAGDASQSGLSGILGG